MNTETEKEAPWTAERIAKVVEIFSKLAQTNAGLPDDFLERLIAADDDWSFVVKGHALLEAAFNEYLVEALGRPSLGVLIERMQLGGSTGKLAIAKAIGGLPPGTIEFASKFKDLRNTAVHNVAETSFSFRQYFDGLTKRDRDAWLKTASLGGFINWTQDPADSDVDLKAIVTGALKAVLSYLNLISLQYFTLHSTRKLALMVEPKSELMRPIFELARGGPVDNDSKILPKPAHILKRERRAPRGGREGRD